MSDIDIDRLREWIGRSESWLDVVSSAPAAGLSALLDITSADVAPGTTLPPLWHWMYFLPQTPASEIGPDGHARKGGFLPPVPLPRRMWAGSRVKFISPMRIGAAVRRDSTIRDVQIKSQGADAKVFVTVRHRIFSGDDAVLTEEQDIVYRNPVNTNGPARSGTPVDDTAMWSHDIFPDPVMLFRYSALTFNAHRIHYDRDYASGEEGYPGLVVHGPLTATLLLHSLHQERPDLAIRTLAIRARKPIFDNAPFSLQGRTDGSDATLWALDQGGAMCMLVTVSGRD